MDETCAWLEATLTWLETLPRSPIHFAGQETTWQNQPAPHLELVYLIEGSVSALQMGCMRTAINAGQVGLFNVHFGNVAQPDDRFKRWCVYLDIDDDPYFDILTRTPLALVASVRHRSVVQRTFSHLVHRCQSLQWTEAVYQPEPRQRRNINDPIRQALLKAALLELLGTLHEESRQISAIGPSIELPMPLVSTINYLHRFYQHQLDLDELATVAHLHPAHLGRLFKEHLGISPMRYLMRFRIKQSSLLLQHSSERVEVVARQVGFTDPFHFSRAFKRVMHYSPRAWREIAACVC